MPGPFSPRHDRLLLAAAGVALLAVAATAWARRLPARIDQIWIPEIQRVDRCVTCHRDVDSTHPKGHLFEKHPFESYGCTLCHGGQGAATTKAAAHGEVPFWEEPIVTARGARFYGLTRGEMMEVRCNVCHRHESVVEGMPLLNEAKALVVQKRCVRCHALDGKGGNTGPDLTAEGALPPEHPHFPADWSKARTALRWHIQHFLDPEAVVPGTEMTKFTLTERQAAGLALLVMSWRPAHLPVDWLPGR